MLFVIMRAFIATSTGHKACLRRFKAAYKYQNPIPGLAESEEALRRSWDDFASRLNEGQKAPFYNYVKAKKASIDSTKDCAYLHGYESALALVSNIGIKVNEDDLGKIYAKLGKGGT